MHEESGELEDDRTFRETGEMDLRREVNMETRFRASGLPWSARRELRLATFRRRSGLDEAVEACEAYARQDAPLLFLTLAGPVGVGKTHLAAAVACEWLEGGRRVSFITAQGLLNRLRDAYDSGRRFSDELARFERVDLLVLDDLGMEKGTPWGESVLDGLIDSRYINRRHTIITTNARGQDLTPRMASRLRDRRIGRVVQVDADDYRTSTEEG